MIHNILPVCRRRSCKQESHMKQLQNKSNTHIPPSARGEVKRNNSIYIQKGLLLCSLSVCLSVCARRPTTHWALYIVLWSVIGFCYCWRCSSYSTSSYSKAPGRWRRVGVVVDATTCHGQRMRGSGTTKSDKKNNEITFACSVKMGIIIANGKRGPLRRNRTNIVRNFHLHWALLAGAVAQRDDGGGGGKCIPVIVVLADTLHAADGSRETFSNFQLTNKHNQWKFSFCCHQGGGVFVFLRGRLERPACIPIIFWRLSDDDAPGFLNWFNTLETLL